MKEGHWLVAQIVKKKKFPAFYEAIRITTVLSGFVPTKKQHCLYRWIESHIHQEMKKKNQAQIQEHSGMKTLNLIPQLYMKQRRSKRAQDSKVCCQNRQSVWRSQLSRTRGKIEDCPLHAKQAQRGGRVIALPIIDPGARCWGGQRDQLTLYMMRGLWRRCGRVSKISPPLGFEPRSVHHEGSTL